MPDKMQAAMLRRWAMQCAAQADDPKNTPEQRERLMKMRVALLDMAKTHDWLEGRVPPTEKQGQPPTQEQEQMRQRAPKKRPSPARKPSRLKGAYEKSRR